MIDDYNDISSVTSEDEIYEKEKQLQSVDVTPNVVTPTVPNIATSSATILDITLDVATSSEIESENESFDISDQVIKDPPTRI